MISLIFCSRSYNIPVILSENIKKTIGCEYELIVIDNSQNTYSIFQAYNIGIKRSRGTIVLLIHEDILFHTKKWGKILFDIFCENSSFDLVGIAGSKIKSRTPSGWWNSTPENKFLNLIQHYPNGKKELQHFGFTDRGLEEVVTVDGVFMALRKSSSATFDEHLNGFHGYDLNLSFEVIRKGGKIGVTDQILLEHFSIGSLDSVWLHSTINIHRKYKKFLPLSLRGKNLLREEFLACKTLVDKCYKLSETRYFYYYSFRLYYLKLKIKLLNI